VRFLVGTFLIVAALLVVFDYSSETAIYECSGTVTKASNTSGPTTLFIKVTQNRWWAFWDPADGRLRWEYTNGNIPTVHGDDPNALRWIRTGPDTLKAAPPFAGMMYFADAREDFFVTKRVDTFLTLYRWPKAGETVDLTTKSTQGRFATISNALTFDISEGAMFNGNCKPKNN